MGVSIRRVSAAHPLPGVGGIPTCDAEVGNRRTWLPCLATAGRPEGPRYTHRMAMFLLTFHRAGPEWQPGRPLEEQSGWEEHAAFMDDLVDAGFIVLGGPLSDQFRVVHAIEAESEDAIRATLARDPWQPSHLVIDSIEPWTIRLDGRG